MFFYLVLSGITTGALYGLIALGITILFKAAGTINFAHGELFMLGGFLAYTFITMMGMPYLLAMLLAVIGAFVFGVITDRIAFRPLIGSRALGVVLATVGFAFILRGSARIIWGGKGDYLAVPPLFSPDPIIIGPLIILPQQLVVIGGTTLVLIAFAAFFRLTRLGKMMQATADNAKAARLVGIRIEHVYTLSFGIGAAVAAMSAVLMAPLTLLYTDMGFALFVKGFAAAALGGLKSLPGAVIGGLLVGLIESLAAGYIASSFLDISAFVVIMVVLIFCPAGLFGGPEARRV
ncbi:MAG TPA: branched-chain amino acid ABC transporter permease [Stellaceae bacterium]|jgi:branched-chain amino acid transport system permease protein|nr:branched-chain amino acid ABC transporter permease [Stellaceae bacterium]